MDNHHPEDQWLFACVRGKTGGVVADQRRRVVHDQPDSEFLRRQTLALNTERMQLLEPELRAAGLLSFDVLGANDVIQALYGPVLVRVRLENQTNIAKGELIICRAPQDNGGKRRLKALLEEYERARQNDALRYFVDRNVRHAELAARFGFVTIEFFQGVLSRKWEKMLARDLMRLVNGYIAKMPD